MRSETLRHPSDRLLSVMAAIGVLMVAMMAPAQADITYTTSWLGNTDGIPEGHIMQDITDLAVTPDGKVVAATHWDEGGTNAAVFKDGKLIARGHETGTGDWGRMSNAVVATDAEYFYFSMVQGGGYGGIKAGESQQEIKRFKYDGKPAGFPGGVQYDKSCLNVVTAADCGDKPVVGLVVHNNELYAADSYSKTMKVYQLPLAGQEVKRSWPITRPGRLAVDADGYIWMLQRKDATNPATLVRFSSTGELQPQQITFANTIEAGDFCVDGANNRILVTNDGADQNVLIYTNVTKSPTAGGTFGVTGGILSGTPGLVAPLKLNRPSGIGIDKAGNIYVANNGIGLEAYDPKGTRLWELLCVMFVDCTDATPGAETVVYGKEERFAMDYSKTAPGTEWSYKGYTLNRFKYPQDPRLHTGAGSVFARVIQGKTFLYMTGMYGEPYSVFRFSPTTDGEVAIPCALFGPKETTGAWPPNRPAKGEWVWSDANGNGAFDAGEFSQPVNPKGDTSSWTWYVDSQGTVWTQNGDKIRSFPCQGLNASGSPIYSYGDVRETSRPESLPALNTLMYDPTTDVMYLTGYTKQYPAPAGYGGGVVGHALMRVNDWSSGNRTPAWTAEVPMDLTKDMFGKAITMAGDYIFSVECRRNNSVTVFSKATGAQVATLTPGKAIGSKQGWVDIPYGINAYQRANGEYLIFVEDDGFLKVVMYRMNDGTPPRAGAPTFNLVPGTYDRAQTVALSTATAGATIRYTTDGTIPTATTGTIYSTPVTVSNSAQLRAIAYKSTLGDSHVAGGHYAINTKVVAPTFSPRPSTFSTPLAVTLGSSTRGATIRYTTDGSTPTPSTGTPYTGPVKFSATTTLKAIALADGMTASDLVTGNYPISPAEIRLTPTRGDTFLFNGNTAEVSMKQPLPSIYTIAFEHAVQVDRLVLSMPSSWGGPVDMKAEIRGGMTPDAVPTIVKAAVYSIAGYKPVNLTIPAANLQYLQIVISASHNGAGNLSEVEVYGHNVQP